MYVSEGILARAWWLDNSKKSSDSTSLEVN